jgi:hypothetical protein
VESDDSPSGLKFKVFCFLKLTDRSGWPGLGQVISGKVRSGQVRFSWFGLDKLGWVRSGQVRSDFVS